VAVLGVAFLGTAVLDVAVLGIAVLGVAVLGTAVLGTAGGAFDGMSNRRARGINGGSCHGGHGTQSAVYSCR
jgi:hypothetical protein